MKHECLFKKEDAFYMAMAILILFGISLVCSMFTVPATGQAVLTATRTMKPGVYETLTAMPTIRPTVTPTPAAYPEPGYPGPDTNILPVAPEIHFVFLPCVSVQ